MLIYKTLHSRDSAPGGNNWMTFEHTTVLEQNLFEMQPHIFTWPVSLLYCILIVVTPQVSDDVPVWFITGSNTELSDWIVDFIPRLQISLPSKGNNQQTLTLNSLLKFRS